MPNKRPERPLPRDLLAFAREMRHSPAPAEQKLWFCLRDRRLGGYKFRRQQPLGRFIADFWCAELRLAIELDGESHLERQQYDASRTRWLERDGHYVLRFANHEVFDGIEAVVDEIYLGCERLSTPHPSPCPLPQGERVN